MRRTYKIMNVDTDSDSDGEQQNNTNGVEAASASIAQRAKTVAAMANSAVPVNSKRKVDSKQKHAKRRASTVPAAPPSTPVAPAMVGSNATANVSENYTDDERALNTFQKLHPLLSLESTSQRALQLVANLQKEIEIPTREVPCITKTYDDQFLRPANMQVGERPCCLGNKCIAIWMAIFRYGEDNKSGFVCREFLTPSENDAFKATGKLPAQPAKCLLCSRYYTTFTYRVARSDPNFVVDAAIPIQAYSNSIGCVHGESIPETSAHVGGDDGYHPSVCLAVDAEFANTEAGRGPMGTLLWRPFVAFHSGHFKYVSTTNGPAMVQVGVSANETPHFGVRQEMVAPASDVLAAR